ncbi:MAG TPA: tagatose 1,6-diphosphate aldolase [Anaerolineae bacterium]|nr:tagatose 1,6-diphosphate aldolase [Anaerolineae bacterium]
MPKTLTVGKVRGLQQIADTHGIFAMCAMDHRGSMQRLINKATPDQVTYDTLVEYKRDLTEALAPESTAVLLDPIYGAAHAIASGALPGDVGLLVSLEETGYEHDAQGRVTTLLPDWSVEKIKRMGASAVKVLLYYRPDLSENAARQREVTRRVAEDCIRADIAFLLEPIAYPISGAEEYPELFAARKPALVADSARDLTPLGVDVLKAEFPADTRYMKDEGVQRAACELLHVSSQSPWILLSAGVTFDEFARQVKIACQAGASGFLGGRAIWEEAMHMPDTRERRQWLVTVGADRMRRLHDIAGEYGCPWWEKWGDSIAALTDIRPDWYRRY